MKPPVGSGRCKHCGWHVATQSHRPDCAQTYGIWPEEPDEPFDWQKIKASYAAQDAAAKGSRLDDAAAAHPETNGKAKPRAGHTKTRTSTRSADELEPWAQTVLDDEIAAVESDPPGERNDQLNKRALRCFRVALAADFDLDDVYDALFDAACIAGNTATEPHTPREIRGTLRSARIKADRDGPAYPDDDEPDVTEVDAEHFERSED